MFKRVCSKKVLCQVSDKYRKSKRRLPDDFIDVDVLRLRPCVSNSLRGGHFAGAILVTVGIRNTISELVLKKRRCWDTAKSKASFRVPRITHANVREAVKVCVYGV
jgi:hypothetical protein